MKDTREDGGGGGDNASQKEDNALTSRVAAVPPSSAPVYPHALVAFSVQSGRKKKRNKGVWGGRSSGRKVQTLPAFQGAPVVPSQPLLLSLTFPFHLADPYSLLVSF